MQNTIIIMEYLVRPILLQEKQREYLVWSYQEVDRPPQAVQRLGTAK